MTSLHLTEIASLAVWQRLQHRVADVTGLSFSLWDDQPQVLLEQPWLPPACQYVRSDHGRRQRCEQFHRSVRGEVLRTRKACCQTCPFGIQYMAVPITGDALMPGHWEGGFAAIPERIGAPDPTMHWPTWHAALAATPMREEREVWAALDLLELLHEQTISALALRERRRAQVVQLVASDLGRTMDASHSLDEALRRFTYLVTQVIGVPIGLLLLKERESGDLVVRAAVGVSDEAVQRTRAKTGQGVAGRVLASGQPLLANRVQGDERFQFDFAPFDKVQSLLGVPIRVDRAIVGVLDVGSYAPDAFTPDDVALIEHIAELLAGFLMHDWVKRTPARDAETITVSLRAAAASLREPQASGALLERILDLVARLMGANSGAIMLVDRESDTLYTRCARGVASERADARVRIGEGAVGWVAETGEPLYLPQVAADGRYAAVREDLKSEVAVPLISDGAVIGVLDVGSDQYHFFSDEQVQLLTILASLTVLAVRAEARAEHPSPA